MTLPSPTDRLLVLHAGALGDCVLTLHLVASMKKTWGGAHVTVAARSSIVRWAQRHGWIDEARSIEELGMHGLYNRDADISPRAIEILQGFDAIFSFLGGCGEIVSDRLAEVSQRRVIAIDPRPPPMADTHIVALWVAQLRDCGLAVDVPSGDEFVMRDRQPFRARLRARIAATGDRIVLCHPGSGGLEKCCPHEVLEPIVEELKARGRCVAWMIGPDEMERFGTEYRRCLEQTAPVLYEGSVELAADLVTGADSFIGNDAGMTHVAALCGVKTIALFGPTDSAIWHPLGPDCTILPFPDDHQAIDSLVREICRVSDRLTA